MLKDEDQIKKLIQEEMRGNLKILIDPKKKDSFSEARISTWVYTVSNRIIHHLMEKNKS